MITLSKNEKNQVVCSKELNFCIETAEGRKFVKRGNEFNLFGELLGMRIARLVGLNCPKYDWTKINNIKYLLSDDIGKGGEFLLAKQALNIKYNSLYQIQSQIKKVFPNQQNELMKDIVKIYIIDILTMNFDRNSKNWGIKIINGKLEVWIFDNEYVFLNDGFPVIYFNKFTSDVKHKNDIDSFLYHISEDVKNFLSSNENFYQYLFSEILSILTPTVIEFITREVVKEIRQEPSGEIFIKDYYKVYEHFKNMVVKNNTIVVNTRIEE